MKTMNFLDLPTDLHFLILSELEPQYLVEVAKTCRDLRRIVDKTIVWSAALRRTCQHHNLFEPSFPIKSMDGRELKRAALGPKFLDSKLPKMMHTEGYGPHSIEPRLETTLCQTHREHSETTDFKQVFLIPGGRYLISTMKSSLLLWDLSPATTPSEDDGSQPVVLETVQFDDCFRMSVPTMHSPRRIHFVLSFEAGDSRRELVAYELGPVPHLRKLSKLTLRLPQTASVKVHAIENGIVYFHVGAAFGAWDFVRGLSASWSGPRVDRLFVVQDLLVGIDVSTGVSAWKAPALHKVDAVGLSMEPEDLTDSPETCWVARYQSTEDGTQLEDGQVASWSIESDVFGPSRDPSANSGSPLTFIYHLVGQSVEDPGLYSSVWRFKLEIANDLASARLTQSGETDQVFLHPAMSGIPSSVHHSISFSSVLMMATGSAQWPELFYGPLLAEDGHSIRWKMASINVKHCADLVEGASLCQASGRLAYICNSKTRHEDRQNRVHIVDLLSWN